MTAPARPAGARAGTFNEGNRTRAGALSSNDLAAPARSCAASSRDSSTRRLIPVARGGVLFLVAVLAVLTGCNGGGDKKLILSANALQIQAAGAYDGAKALEDAAGRDCAAKAAAAGQALAAPTRETVPQILAACASLGAPIPFDPFKLADLAGPLNGAYEAIRAADAIRRGAQPGDLPRSIGAVIEAISRLWQAAADVGVALPANTLGGKP